MYQQSHINLTANHLSIEFPDGMKLVSDGRLEKHAVNKGLGGKYKISVEAKVLGAKHVFTINVLDGTKFVFVTVSPPDWIKQD